MSNNNGRLTIHRLCFSYRIIYSTDIMSIDFLHIPVNFNAGGIHNLLVDSSDGLDDLPTLMKRMGSGLYVTELLGQGVNGVTGDYSRGAAGYWVEGGRIAHPVHEVTIAGNLKDMLRQIVAVGADSYVSGGRTLGSVLVERMKVAGS